MTFATNNTQDQHQKISHGFDGIKDLQGDTKKRVCQKHGEYLARFITAMPNKKIYSACPQCNAEWNRRKEAERGQEVKSKSAQMIKMSNIPTRYLKSSMAGYDIDNNKNKAFALKVCQKYVSAFPERKKDGCSLVMCGTPGTGKTHLACAIALELMRKGDSARYCTVYKAVNAIKNTYSDRGMTESQVLKSFLSPSLLILDG